MSQYTIILSDAEEKALAHVAVSVEEWIQQTVHFRAQKAIEQIASSEIERKLSLGETISGTKEEIVMAAEVETAANRNVRIMAELEEQQAAQQG